MIFTIGHSNHALADFLALLKGAGVTAVADVRSAPYSRWVTHFNKAPLAAALRERGIAYVHLGRELGGRPREAARLKAGQPDYAAIAQSADFRAGLARVVEGSRRHRIALMCAERDPLDCHRFRLVARALAARGERVAHILPDGRIEEHAQTEARAAAREGAAGDLFGGREDGQIDKR